MRYFLLVICLFLTSCIKDSCTIKVAATSVPHAEMLEIIKEDFEKEGYKLKILVIDDYQLPNRLLAENQVDANFFQHVPFLEKEKKEFGYKIEALSKVHIEPLGVFSKKHTSLTNLPFKSKVTIPSDPTNEARALLLLEQANLIKLKNNASFYATTLDILENPNCLIIKEIDAPLLPRTLSDVDVAVIPGNFALMANLSKENALLLETASSPYINVFVIRSEDKERKELKILADLLGSEKMEQFVAEKYNNKISLIAERD